MRGLPGAKEHCCPAKWSCSFCEHSIIAWADGASRTVKGEETLLSVYPGKESCHNTDTVPLRYV